MTKWQYLYAGLRVNSEIELPEWEAFIKDDGAIEWDVFIRIDVSLREVMQQYENAPLISPCEYRFYLPEVGGYLVSRGKEITVFPMPDAGVREVRLFLLGTAWGVLCYQRGMFVLHAGSVGVRNHAMLFCAHQQMGKSTMTAWLTTHGHNMLSDDLSCVEMSQTDLPSVYQSSQRIRLWSDSLDSLNWSHKKMERDHFRYDKFQLTWCCEKNEKPMPIKAIYLLNWGELKLEKLSGMNALERFVAAATYRGEILEKMGLSGTYWQRCLDLVRQVQVWELTRPRDLSIMKDVLVLLEDHWINIIDDTNTSED